MGHRAYLRAAVACAIALLSAWVACAPAQAALVTLFPLPPSLKNPDQIVSTPDGSLWFTQFDAGRDTQASILGRITTAGEATAVALPAGSEPRAIANGPDAALWYAAAGPGAGRLGRVTTAPAGEFGLPSGSARGIVTGPDGALWFTTQRRIGRFVPGAAMSFFAVAGAKDLHTVVRGPDDALWFTDLDAAVIRRIATDGAVRSFPLPIGEGGSALAAGPDGALWFVTERPNRLGRITTSGRIRIYSQPQIDNIPVSVAAGPDGAIWYSHLYGIGRITGGGEITELPISQADDELTFYNGLTSGPDGAVWFAQRESLGTRGEIGRIDVAGSAARLLVTRLADRRLRGRAGRTLRVAFTATRRSTGTLRLDSGRKRAIARQRVRAQAGANVVTLRLPRRPGTYRLLLRLGLRQRVATAAFGRLPSQSGSDSAPLTVTR